MKINKEKTNTSVCDKGKHEKQMKVRPCMRFSMVQNLLTSEYWARLTET